MPKPLPGPCGLGLLSDQAGNDTYLATGQLPGSYGQAGVFSGFSQGFASGLRNHAAGGMAILLDAQGYDRLRAGNFSQGGAYYFALGLLYNGGDQGDEYVGSRYAQGFSAHSALGLLLEAGGNDVYRGEVGALQAAAWDLGAAMLWDQGGNDQYLSKGRFFSLAAAAHNGLAVLVDERGEDVYQFEPGSRIAGNDYHGGNSLSLFWDKQGQDRYQAELPQATSMEAWLDE